MQHDTGSGLPGFLSNSPKILCEQIIWLVKNSNLNFSLSETPFSLKLDIKKKFVNFWPSAAAEPRSSFVFEPSPTTDQAVPSPSVGPDSNLQKKLEASILQTTELEKELNLTKAKNIKLEKENKIIKIECETLSKNLMDQSQKTKATFEEIKVLKGVMKKNMKYE